MSKFAPPNQNVPMSGGRFVHVDHFYLFEADVNQKSDGANLDSTLTMLRPTTTLLKLLSDQTYDGANLATGVGQIWTSFLFILESAQFVEPFIINK